METIPLINRLQQAGDILQEVADMARLVPEHQIDAAMMVTHVSLTRCYLAELALNLARGHEPYEAILRTAAGKTPISETTPAHQRH